MTSWPTPQAPRVMPAVAPCCAYCKKPLPKMEVLDTPQLQGGTFSSFIPFLEPSPRYPFLNISLSLNGKAIQASLCGTDCLEPRWREQGLPELVLQRLDDDNEEQ